MTTAERVCGSYTATTVTLVRYLTCMRRPGRPFSARPVLFASSCAGARVRLGPAAAPGGIRAERVRAHFVTRERARRDSGMERGEPPGRDMALSGVAVSVPIDDESVCSRRDGLDMDARSPYAEFFRFVMRNTCGLRTYLTSSENKKKGCHG